MRATLVGPALFAIALEVLDDPAFATMAIFGATAALVFADFGGPVPERVRAYACDRGRRRGPARGRDAGVGLHRSGA